jgi:Na+/citrate or Na+/malate symporter
MKISDRLMRNLMTLCLFLGIGIAYIAVKFIENKYLAYLGILLGGVLACVSGYFAQARMLGIKYPDDSYRKAKDSYKDEK